MRDLMDSSFDSFGLARPILRAIESRGYTTPTRIQVDSIPLILNGNDVLGCAQTGTGKARLAADSTAGTDLRKQLA